MKKIFEDSGVMSDDLLARIRQVPSGAHPIQVLTLTGPLFTSAMREACISGCKMLSPPLCLRSKMRVPLQSRTVHTGLVGRCFTC